MQSGLRQLERRRLTRGIQELTVTITITITTTKNLGNPQGFCM